MQKNDYIKFDVNFYIFTRLSENLNNNYDYDYSEYSFSIIQLETMKK